MAGEIDEALELLEGCGPEFTGGLSNHGPMAAEALVALGRPDAVLPWVEEYRKKLYDRPPSTTPISPEEWRESLGDGRKLGDWRAFFERELSDAPWQQVLDTWVARLAPGLIAAATHGVIRTGHAVRTLATGDTPERRDELAAGLGYWAARYQRLPEGLPSTAGTALPSQAIQDVAVIPIDKRKRGGLITHGIQAVAEHPEFPAVINLVEASGDASAFVSDLTETFASIYLANAHDVLSTIVFIHAVTGPSAVHLLAPHLSQETTASALRYGWQAAAALYAGFGETAAAAAAIEDTEQDVDDLIDSAVATGDEHAIKFTEACLREHALNPKPVYLAAARDATARLRSN